MIIKLCFSLSLPCVPKSLQSQIQDRDSMIARLKREIEQNHEDHKEERKEVERKLSDAFIVCIESILRS